MRDRGRHTGQLIDRTGQLLGLQFPAGRALDKLSREAVKKTSYLPKKDGCHFSLSGVEHKMTQMREAGEEDAEIAYFSLASVVRAVHQATAEAKRRFGDMTVLYSGGVASNSLLRAMTPDGIFAEPRYSTDNAMGTAILTWRAVNALG